MILWFSNVEFVNEPLNTISSLIVVIKSTRLMIDRNIIAKFQVLFVQSHWLIAILLHVYNMFIFDDFVLGVIKYKQIREHSIKLFKSLHL